MHFTRLAVVVGLTTFGSSAAAGEARNAADDTLYPAMAAMVEGTAVGDAEVVGSDGIVYPGPRTVFVRAPAASGGGAQARIDDTTYPREPLRIGAIPVRADGT